MTNVDGCLRNDSNQKTTMLGEMGRRISEDVASLDSWTDALNGPSNLDFQHLSDELPRTYGPGSGFVIRENTPVSRNKGHNYVTSRHLSDSSFDPSFDVVDSGFGPSLTDDSHHPKHEDVHINHSNKPDHSVWHTDYNRSRNFVKPEDPRPTSGVAAWFNNLTTPSPILQPHRPHAFSNASVRELRNVNSGIGLNAHSRYGLAGSLANANFTSTGYPASSRQRSTQSTSASNGSEFGSDTLSHQLDRESEKIKTKFMSAWNNVKYGWTLKTKTNFRCDSPIFLLGKCYHRKTEGDDADLHIQRPQRSENKVSTIDEFHQDFSSRMWFTYRREFTPLPGTKLTTDCGWGCMLRSGQMLLAQGLISHFLGRDWRVYQEPKREQKAFYKEIIRWFTDQISDQVPFSIHKMVEVGQKHGKFPGAWYGPASVALILRDSLIKAYSGLPVLNDVCIYVAPDCTVYKQDVLDLCESRPKSFSQVSCDSSTEGVEPTTEATNHEWKRSVIILVPMRLGGECLNPIYIPCVKALLANDNCIGIIGGKPKHSLYFVGWQEDKLINLDPHYCQDVVDTTPHDFPVQSFHCVSPRKLSFNKMDPSCTVGFYLSSRQQFDDFVKEVGKLVIPPLQKGLYPLFIFSEGRSSDINMDHTTHKEQGRLKIRHYRVDRDGNVRSPTLDSEDFVIL